MEDPVPAIDTLAIVDRVLKPLGQVQSRNKGPRTIAKFDPCVLGMSIIPWLLPIEGGEGYQECNELFKCSLCI